MRSRRQSGEETSLEGFRRYGRHAKLSMLCMAPGTLGSENSSQPLVVYSGNLTEFVGQIVPSMAGSVKALRPRVGNQVISRWSVLYLS